jgi:hypothetical protein
VPGRAQPRLIENTLRIHTGDCGPPNILFHRHRKRGTSARAELCRNLDAASREIRNGSLKPPPRLPTRRPSLFVGVEQRRRRPAVRLIDQSEGAGQSRREERYR